ncbi:MAG: type II secretion system protein [Anaerovoracaceae bacterium]
MMKFMNKKLTKKGFTLAELLIVVAILAILVAVSIPIFTGKLDAAREATDNANVRAAKAAAVAYYLDANAQGSDTAVAYIYDAENGKILTAALGDGKGYNQKAQGSVAAKGGAVQVVIKANGAEINTSWVDDAAAPSVA